MDRVVEPTFSGLAETELDGINQQLPLIEQTIEGIKTRLRNIDNVHPAYRDAQKASFEQRLQSNEQRLNQLRARKLQLENQIADLRNQLAQIPQAPQ
jgi:chromosome segregation ATPase